MCSPNRTAFDEVRSYLKKNSLVAKRLTIFDVLHPTSVNIREPQHIQVIDRYVLSKVWNDVSLFAVDRAIQLILPLIRFLRSSTDRTRRNSAWSIITP